MIKKYKVSEKTIRMVIGLLMMHLFITFAMHINLSVFMGQALGLSGAIAYFSIYAPSIVGGMLLTYYYLTRVYLYKNPVDLKKLGVDVIE